MKIFICVINILFIPALIYVLSGWIEGGEEIVLQYISPGWAVALWFVCVMIVIIKLQPPD